MIPVEYDATEFYDGLVAHRLIVPVGVQGIFGRGAVFEDVLERFNRLLTRTSCEDDAEWLAFPPVISRKVLEQVHYLDSFPQLCGAVCSFFGDETQAQVVSERVHQEQSWNDLLGMTDVILNPAACYPVYPSFRGVTPENGRTVTMLNWVFRHEPSAEPTRMQSFRVREFVRVGTPNQVSQWRDMWLARSMSLLQSLSLPVNSEAATDPFFGRVGEMLAATQLRQRLKFEIHVPIIPQRNPTAICSFNLHEQHFSATFDIRTADGNVANTACVGFGLERVVMALFKTHGFDVNRWPAAVRQRLWER